MKEWKFEVKMLVYFDAETEEEADKKYEAFKNKLQHILPEGDVDIKKEVLIDPPNVFSEEKGRHGKSEKPIDVILKSREEDRCPFCANTVSQHELPWFCLISQVRDCESPCTVDDWKRCPLRNVPHQKIVDYLR